MKKIKYLAVIFISIISFYYTEQIALYVKSKNPLIQEIESNKEELYVNSINSELIDEQYIIPGINGKEVNVNSPYLSMKELNIYNESKIVYNQISPSISLTNNKDRIIIRGNPKKRQVSLIFEKSSTLTEYLTKNNYEYNVLINKEKYSNKYEMINFSTNKTTFNNINSYLTTNNLNTNICHKNNQILCKDSYIFQESLTINHSNISNTINKNKLILIL